MAVHQDFTGNRPQPAFFGHAEVSVDRLRVCGTKDRRGGETVLYRLRQEKPRGISRIFRVQEFSFFWERVSVEPIQEFRAVRSDHTHLGIVHVAVDKTG